MTVIHRQFMHEGEVNAWFPAVRDWLRNRYGKLDITDDYTPSTIKEYSSLITEKIPEYTLINWSVHKTKAWTVLFLLYFIPVVDGLYYSTIRRNSVIVILEDDLSAIELLLSI